MLNLNAVGFNTSCAEPVCKRTAYSNNSKRTAERPSVKLGISAIFEVDRGISVIEDNPWISLVQPIESNIEMRLDVVGLQDVRITLQDDIFELRNR